MSNETTPVAATETNSEGPNILFSYSMADDHAFQLKGHSFMGVALDEKGHEVHVFMKAPRAPSDAVSTNSAIPDALDALETLVGHVGHYASFPQAHSDAYRDHANARAALRKARIELGVSNLQPDLTKLTQLLTAFGVEFTTAAKSGNGLEGTTITCNADVQKVEGYNGFSCS